MCYSVYIDAAFTHQPNSQQLDPTLLLAPFGTHRQLNCSVSQEFTIEWEVAIPTQVLRVFSAMDLLTFMNITLLDISGSTSQLNIEATADNTGSVIECVARAVGIRCRSEPVRTVFYGML